MSVDVTTAVVIERPIDEVAEYAGDPSNAPEWYRRIESADWQTDPPISLGSKIAFRAKFLGRDLAYTYEVTEFSPSDQITMKSVDGPFPMTTTYTWRRVGDRVTHMTMRNHGEPGGPMKLASPLIVRAMRRAMNQDLTDLKRLLEAG